MLLAYLAHVGHRRDSILVHLPLLPQDAAPTSGRPPLPQALELNRGSDLPNKLTRHVAPVQTAVMALHDHSRGAQARVAAPELALHLGRVHVLPRSLKRTALPPA